MKQFSDKIARLLAAEGATPYQIEQECAEPVDLALELLHAQGVLLVEREGRYRFETTEIDIDDAVFCIVDIETNGSKPEKHQIIEIGAVKVQNYTIIDQYESLVQCDEISPHISEITGISVEDTTGAPSLKTVLQELRTFLGSAIFVAHDVKFDYSFISAMFKRYGEPPLMNRPLCTIDLAERTISSYRYGLKYLNEQLELYREATHHRALSDAITTAKLFKRTLRLLPEEIRTAEALIQFSKQGKRVKRPKFDPKVLKEREAEKEGSGE